MPRPVLRSYKLTVDSGFAPNPFWGLLTLATCKPGIRRVSKEGEWIAGFTSTKKPWCDPVRRERLIYLMQVEQVVPYAEYYRGEEFRKKIPVADDPDRRLHAGDNMYIPTVDDPAPDQFELVKGASHGEDEKPTDLSGRNALVARRFVYFGREPLTIPTELRPDLPEGPSYYGRFTQNPDRVVAFIKYVESVAGLEGALRAMPSSWLQDHLAPPGARCASRRPK